MRTRFLAALAVPAALAVALGAVAVGRSHRSTDPALSSDLQRDLQLATSSSIDNRLRISPDEEVPHAAPAPALRPREAASGSRVVKAKHRAPTVRAAPKPDPVATTETTQEVAQAPATQPEQHDPEPARSSGGAELPRPVPSTEGAPGGAGRQDGSGRDGSTASDGGAMGTIGTILGVILRGGVVDGDHCDPRTDGRRRSGGVYYPGGYPGGMGGSRFPRRGGYPNIPINPLQAGGR